MFRIGLTGGIGSGKSTAADFFRSKEDVTVIDLDQLARIVVMPGSPALQKISDRFGKSILQTNGELDRQKLGKIIFSDISEKFWLESLLHPLIDSEKERILESSQSHYAVIEIPLLVENKRQTDVDRVLLIDCNEELQIERVKFRGQQTEEQIRKIVALQASRDERKAVADDIVENDGEEQELKEKLEVLHQKYLDLT